MKREIEVTPTVEELAGAFAELGSREQGLFFVLVDAFFRAWGPYERDNQILSVGEALTEHASTSAVELVRGIADAASPIVQTPLTGGEGT
jgi:hypothetical protein